MPYSSPIQAGVLSGQVVGHFHGTAPGRPRCADDPRVATLHPHTPTLGAFREAGVANVGDESEHVAQRRAPTAKAEVSKRHLSTDAGYGSAVTAATASGREHHSAVDMARL